MSMQKEQIRIAVVDDQEDCVNSLKNNLDRYAAEHNCEFSIHVATNSMEFVTNYVADYDIIFLDVVMPKLDGMKAAASIREIDKGVCIIFVTNYAQYAIRGYEVQAFSYILKPFLYGNFVLTMDKALRYYNTKRNNFLTVQTAEGILRFSLDELMYVESQEHYLHYYGTEQTIRKRGKLSEVENLLCDKGFSRCSVSYLVNMRYIRKIESTAVILRDGTQILISRRYKTRFLTSFADFVGRGGML